MKLNYVLALTACILLVSTVRCSNATISFPSTVSSKLVPTRPVAAPVTSHPGWTSYTNSNHITSIAFDNDGNVWTAGGGLVQWDVKNNTYTKFLPENGLPTTNINAIAFASDDSLWIAGEGIFRFDGQIWLALDIKDKWASREIEELIVAPNGDVWISTWEIVARFDGQTWTSYSPETDIQAGSSVTSMAVTPDGRVLVGTFEGGDGAWLSVFDGKTWKSHSSSDVRSIAVSPDNTVWLGTRNGIEKFNLSTGRTQIVRRIYGVRNLVVTPEGKLWFSVCSGFWRSDDPNGIWSFDGEGWQVYTSKRDFISCGVSATEVAPADEVWFGTKQGLSRFDGNTWPTYATGDVLASNQIDRLAVGDDGVLWVLSNKGTIHASRFQTAKWTTYELDGNPAPDVFRIGPLVPASNSTAWYGSLNGAKYFDGQAWSTVGLEGEEIRDIAIAPDGKVWFTTYNSVSSLGSSLETFKCGEKLSCTFIDNLLVSPDGSVWVDARNDGILHFDGMQWIPYRQFGENQLYSFIFAENGDLWAIGDDTNKLVRFDGQDWASFVLPADLEDWRNVITMAVTSDGDVWIFHTIKAGDLFSLYHFDGKEWNLRQYPQLLPGALSDVGTVPYQIITSANGVVWAITQTGIQYFDDGEWRLVTTDNGVVSNWVTTVAEGPDRTVWFGTPYGISRFSPP